MEIMNHNRVQQAGHEGDVGTRYGMKPPWLHRIHLVITQG